MPQAVKLFSKSLTDTDTRKRLAIPVKILPALPDFNGSHAVKIHLIYGTRVWPIVCSVRKNGYKKPVFSHGWRNFVICNNFNVGDELTLYKVHDDDEAGSSHYRVEVEKPAARPSGDLSPRADLSLNHELVDETTGTSLTKVPNFEYEQEQQLKADAPPIKEEGAIMELACVADDDAPVPFVDHVISKPPSCWIFGTNLCDEATRKAHFKTEQETENKFIGITKAMCCMGEPPLHSYYMTKIEREINFFGLAEGGAMAYGTSQAAGEACYNSRSIERHSCLDLVLGQSTPYAGEVLNLDLTLELSIVDGGQEAPVFVDHSNKTMVGCYETEES